MNKNIQHFDASLKDRSTNSSLYVNKFYFIFKNKNTLTNYKILIFCKEHTTKTELLFMLGKVLYLIFINRKSIIFDFHE